MRSIAMMVKKLLRAVGYAMTAVCSQQTTAVHSLKNANITVCIPSRHDSFVKLETTVVSEIITGCCGQSMIVITCSIFSAQKR